MKNSNWNVAQQFYWCFAYAILPRFCGSGIFPWCSLPDLKVVSWFATAIETNHTKIDDRYKRDEIGVRTAILYCGNIISNAFGALLASGILGSLNGALGHTAWR